MKHAFAEVSMPSRHSELTLSQECVLMRQLITHIGLMNCEGHVLDSILVIIDDFGILLECVGKKYWHRFELDL